MTAVTKLESLKYVEWAHGSALECVCASHPLFFFVISQMKKEGKNRGQRFHMILKNAFGPMNVAVVLASSGPPVGLDWVTCHNNVSAYFVATDSVLGFDQTAYWQSVARPFSRPRTAPWIVF